MDNKHSLADQTLVEMKRGRKNLRFGNGRVMREDIPSEIKIFRDAYFRYEVLVSKDLAAKIVYLASRSMPK